MFNTFFAVNKQILMFIVDEILSADNFQRY
jgi:hypothetical protein